MANKLTKKQLKEIQSLATKLVESSGVERRVPAVPAHNVYKKKRCQAVKEAHAALYGKQAQKKSKSDAKQTKMKFKD
jgi:hypothetical protein